MATDSSSNRQSAYNFLNSSQNAALSVLSLKNKPYTSIIDFLVDQQLNIYFVTGVESRIFQALIHRPSVSLVVFKHENSMLRSIELNGVARRLDNLAEEQSAIEKISRRAGNKTPIPFLELFNHGVYNELALIKVVPQEMAMIEYSLKEDNKQLKFHRPVITRH